MAPACQSGVLVRHWPRSRAPAICILAGGDYHDYRQAYDDVRERTRRLRDICNRFGVDIRAVALQFSAAPRAVAAVVVGTTRPERIAENQALMTTPIPNALWQTLWDEGLVSMDAPIPGAV